MITEPSTLIDLEQMLPEEFAKPVCDYLRATRKVYELCMANEVSSDYPEYFKEFKRSFLVLHKLIKLQWTLKVIRILSLTLKLLKVIKVHIVADYYPEYFKLCGTTFRYTSDEYVEAVHCRLSRMEVRHNIHISSKGLGSTIHKKRSLRSICLWNWRILASKK